MTPVAVTARFDCVKFQIQAYHAIRLIKAWNKDFHVTGFAQLTPEQLWQEFSCEYLLFSQMLKRAPVAHMSTHGLWYRPKEPAAVYLKDSVYHLVTAPTAAQRARMHDVT